MIEMDGIIEEPLYSYTISSSDMRYIEIGRRDIYLQTEPDIGLVFKGRVGGCGPSCFADLAEILLEFSLSCEGCRDEGEAKAKVEAFGSNLANILVEYTRREWEKYGDMEKLLYLFSRLLNSMNSQFNITKGGNTLVFAQAFCPLRASAKDNSLERGLELAHLGFVSMCKKLLTLSVSEWELQKPLEHEASLPLSKIILNRIKLSGTMS